MREIKFRAWDKINKRWCKNFKVDLLSIPIHEMPHIVIEQYTGVKDVNNIEIYENDIVETAWWNDKEEKYRTNRNSRKYAIRNGGHFRNTNYSMQTIKHRAYEVFGNGV